MNWSKNVLMNIMNLSSLEKFPVYFTVSNSQIFSERNSVFRIILYDETTNCLWRCNQNWKKFKCKDFDRKLVKGGQYTVMFSGCNEEKLESEIWALTSYSNLWFFVGES